MNSLSHKQVKTHTLRRLTPHSLRSEGTRVPTTPSQSSQANIIYRDFWELAQSFPSSIGDCCRSLSSSLANMMATPPFPPCGYSREELKDLKKFNPDTLCCTILCDGNPCGRQLKDHPFQAQLTAPLTPQQPQDVLSVRALIEEGNKLLPNLTFVGHTPTPVNSTHEAVNIVESEFRFCNLPSLRSDDASELIASGRFRGKSVGVDYHNEASVESVTIKLLADILKALDIYDKFTVHQQATQDVNERGDVFVLSVFGVVLLILEVKRPSEQLSDLTHRNCLGQVFDYLQVNRECASLGYCFGVWTTYNSCRLIWLNDKEHNALAVAESVEENFKFPLPPDEYDWDARRVCASKIYNKDDNIPKLLACLIWKLFNSELEAKTVLYRNHALATTTSTGKKKNVKFRTVNEKGYFFQANSGTIEQLTFHSPGTKTKQFYLIRQCNGRDGKVWLSVNKSGRFAMVKFRKSGKTFTYTHKEKVNEDGREDNNEDATAQLSHFAQSIKLEDSDPVNSELNVWKIAYSHLDAKPFSVTLANNNALVMPFSFCYNSNGELLLKLSSYLPCDDTFASDFGDWDEIEPLLLESANVDPVDNLFSAIKTLASKLVLHRDIKWEHLALLPVFGNNVIVRLVPILIDLADVEITLSALDALSSMCYNVLESSMLNFAQKVKFNELFAFHRSTEQEAQGSSLLAKKEKSKKKNS